MSTHDQDLAEAFDGQAERFERAPVQTDGTALGALVRFTGLEAGRRVLDCGCGPGLVAEAFLEAGCDVTGVDLSGEMVARARARCARFGARALFERASLMDGRVAGAFDAAISRSVLHHVSDAAAFVARQAELVRPGGVVVASDHVADPDPVRGTWQQDVERLRDRTHTRCLSPGALVELFALAGLEHVRYAEEPFELDFDEWFDRGTPAASKAEVRALLVSGSARGFVPAARADGGVTISCCRALVRGELPALPGLGGEARPR